MKGGLSMFTTSEKKYLEDSYFKVLCKDSNYYEIQSRNTKHCWLIQKPDKSVYVHTMHKYRKSVKRYHDQCDSISVESALKKIKKHDKYILWHKN